MSVLKALTKRHTQKIKNKLYIEKTHCALSNLHSSTNLCWKLGPHFSDLLLISIDLFCVKTAEKLVSWRQWRLSTKVNKELCVGESLNQ